MDKYFPDGDKFNSANVYGYITARAMVQILKQCGDELTRENIMTQAAARMRICSKVEAWPGHSKTTAALLAAAAMTCRLRII